MAVAIKVDEALPQEVAALFQKAGHDAQTVAQQNLPGTTDVSLWEAVQSERRCLVTADKGFANAQAFPPGAHGGIVLLRLPRESRAGYIRLTESLLEKADVESAVGAIVVVTPAAVRIYRGA